jgi:peptidoglycan/LPS O-acetylase OafA/YrhL
MWGDCCLAWFTFYYLGLLLGNRIIVRHYSLKRLIILYLIAIMLEMAEGYWRLKLVQVNCATMIKFSSLLTSTLFVLMVYTMLQNDRYAIRNRFLEVLGDYSFGIYLSHIMVMNLMWAFIPGFISVPYPISSFMIVLVSFACCYLGSKILGKSLCRWFGLT